MERFRWPKNLISAPFIESFTEYPLAKKAPNSLTGLSQKGRSSVFEELWVHSDVRLLFLFNYLSWNKISMFFQLLNFFENKLNRNTILKLGKFFSTTHFDLSFVFLEFLTIGPLGALAFSVELI